MRTVLVTGGTVRLGKAIADCLRAAGWHVLTSSHRPDAGADFLADLAAPAGGVSLYAAVLARLGRPPDALVNNAALFTGSDEAVFNVNVLAPQKLTTLMAAREHGRGAVVNILDAMPRAGAYGDAKAALADYTRKAAALFAATLRVNAVAPGSVLAPVNVHEKAAENLLGRPRAEDVAEAVAYLLTAQSTTGVTIPVDGGASLLNTSC